MGLLSREDTRGRAEQRQAGSMARARLLRDLPTNERSLDVNGIATAVLEGGRGSPLVLLHGGIECGGAYWAPVIPGLAARHRLVVPDVPGLGESDPVARLDAVAFADWLAVLLRLTCQETPTLVAHSLLGSMAAGFAAGRRGDQLRQLVIYGAPGIGPYRIPMGLRIAAIRFALRPSEPNAERFDRWAFVDLDRVRGRQPDWFEAFSTYTRARATIPHVKRTMRQLIGSCTHQIPDAELRCVRVPTSLLWGDRDRFVPLTLAQATSSRLGWPLRVIDDAGHAAHIEQPDDFSSALDEAMRTQS